MNRNKNSLYKKDKINRMNIAWGGLGSVCEGGWHTALYFLLCITTLSEDSSEGECEEEGVCVAGIGCSLVGRESGRGGGGGV